jgi:putative SOS response-associated peptidase YedK
MCGRARLSSDVSEIKIAFGIPPERPTPNIAPSWNLAPTDPAPIVYYVDQLRQVSQASIVENKHLGAVLSHIRERQIERAEARSQSAPRRQGQVGHMFKVG